MGKQTTRPACVIALALLAGVPGLARAQYPSSAGTYGSSSMLANPYANPYLNPYLNPYMMMQPNAQSNNAAANNLLYFAAAQQAMGGIGSGRLSGTRPGPTAVAATDRPQTSRTSAGLNARTARYFNRGQENRASLGRYYGRRDSYFPQAR